MMFFFRIFTVSGLTLRSLIHFEFIFVYGVRKCYSFILLWVFDNGVKNIQWRKYNLFNKWWRENWSTACKRM